MGALTSSSLRGADGLISETDHTGQSPITAYNPHGGTAALTDQSGNITASYRYDAFGNATAGDSPRNGYTGKWQRDSDSATGTIRMGVREYDPALGRFTSADPLKGRKTNPQTRNRYEYALNNPSKYYDLTGLYLGEGLVDWLEGSARSAGMFFQWTTGTGDEYREYGPEDIQTRNMMDSSGVNEARSRFYAKNSGKCSESWESETYDYQFGLNGLWRAGLDPTEQYVGGYTVQVTSQPDGTVKYEVENRTSLPSFLYHLPGIPDYGRSDFQFAGNMFQTYTWTEQK